MIWIPLSLSSTQTGNISKCSRMNFIHVLCYFIVLPSKQCVFIRIYSRTGLLPSSYFLAVFLCYHTRLEWGRTSEWVSTRSVRTWQFKYASMYLYFPHFPWFSAERLKMFLIESLSLFSPYARYPIATLVCGSNFAYTWSFELRTNKNGRWKRSNNLECSDGTFKMNGASHKCF